MNDSHMHVQGHVQLITYHTIHKELNFDRYRL
jgi:hypothetical protein